MSIFHDKALKGVAEAAAKIMAETSHGSHPKTDKEKSLAALAHPKDKITHKDVLVGRGVIKKEEVEQLDEVGDTPAGRKALGSYVTKAIADKSKDRTKGLRKATSRMYKDNFYGKKNEEVEATEQEQLNEAFPTVADAKKRMDAGKTATGSVTKTATGLVHKRDYKDDDNDDAPKKSTGYGARQNYKRSTRVNESASFTEMLELYNEHGLKVLAPIEKEEMDIDGTTIEVIDGDKINGFVQTTVEEEVTNDEFTKEYEDQKASFEGKKKQPKVAAGRTMGVKTMPESVELDEAKKPMSQAEKDKVVGAVRAAMLKSHGNVIAGQAQLAAARLAAKIKAGKSGMKEEVEQIDERELTKGEAKKKEEYVKGMKKGLSGFKQRYGERAKSVMYATATQMAKKD